MGNENSIDRAWFTPRLAIVLIAAVCVALFVIRLTGPSNLTDNDQQRPAAYVVDVVVNGQWLVQHDVDLDITSKPPVYTWMAAIVSLLVGQVNLWTLYLPCFISTLALSLIIFHFGNRYFGLMAGFFGALTLVLSPIGMKQIALARTDSVFALTVILVFIAAWRAWNYGKSWIPFWLASALTTLTKGPLGLVLGAAGLLVAVRLRPQTQCRKVWLGHLLGIACFVLIAGGWFYLAWLDSGQALIDKMIGKELLGHAALAEEADGSSIFGTHLVKPALYFLSRFAPWSLLAVAGIWRVFKYPAADPDVRRFEVYVTCFFLFGVALFSPFPHQRPDLLYPLIPAAALLAGRELALWGAALPTRRVLGITAAVVALSMVFAIYEYHVRLAGKSYVRFAERTREFAEELDSRVGTDFPLIHVGSSYAPYALQFNLQTMRPRISGELAARALESDHAAFVVVSDRDQIDPYLDANVPDLYEVMQWPPATGGDYIILSNHPKLEETPQMAFAVPGLLLEMDSLQLIRATGNDLDFGQQGENGQVAITNTGDRERFVNLNVSGRDSVSSKELSIAPGQTLIWAPRTP